MTDCNLTMGKISIHLELVSGHLDSNKVKERAEDWGVIYEKTARSASAIRDFDDLAKLMPHIRIIGYDANTRNKIIDKDIVNPWTAELREVKGFLQAPLGGLRYSGESTSKSYDPTIGTTPATGKRLGYTKGGQLDIVEILLGQVLSDPSINITDATVIHPGDESTNRDHAVVISPSISFDMLDDFTNVKTQMTSLLRVCAPQLSSDILNLDDTEKNKSLLVAVYKDFLSKEGLVNQEIKIYIQQISNSAKLEKKVTEQSDSWFPTMGLDKYYSMELTTILQRQKNGITPSPYFGSTKSNLSVKNDSLTSVESASEIDDRNATDEDLSQEGSSTDESIASETSSKSTTATKDAWSHFK